MTLINDRGNTHTPVSWNGKYFKTSLRADETFIPHAHDMLNPLNEDGFHFQNAFELNIQC